jgi:tetratricopeptide (TPR) repeat protein
MVKYLLSIFCLAILLAGCKENPKPVVIGLDGREFFEPERSPEQQFKLEKELEDAKRDFDKDPTEDNYIWYGRREAYLMHFDKALEIFSEGIERYPESFSLYRHRGHRYITLREFDLAIADFRTAAKLMEGAPILSEQDGIPNKLNIPVSTVQFNVWYHLGLAHYLKGEYEDAAKAYETCLTYCDNDDLLIATVDWLFITYHHLQRKEDAVTALSKVPEKVTIVENETYLKRLDMYKGLNPPELLLAVESGSESADLAFATQGYGVGNWYLIQGDTTRAKDVFKRVVEGPYFSAFGFIAAEAELLKLK